MFDALGRFAHRGRWAVLLLTVAFVALSLSWGSGVFGELADGGFEDPDTESSRADSHARDYFGDGGQLVVAVRGSDMTVDSPAYERSVRAMLADLPEETVSGAVHHWNSPNREGLVTEEGRITYLLVSLRPGALDEEGAYEELRDALEHPDLSVRLGGSPAVEHDLNTWTERDLQRAELIAMPALLVLLLAVFGSVFSAVLPLVLGMVSVLGSLTLLRALTLVTDVSVFAVNMVTMLGLGLAIDYSLLMVTRYREELLRRGPVDAVVATVTTAGRTVAFSALTVAGALGGLLLFPQMFLRSVGLGGVCVVLFALFTTLTLLPALLALLGRRVESLSMPWRPRLIVPRHRRYRPGPWRKGARLVMRHPGTAMLLVTLVLALLTLPFFDARFGTVDARTLPSQAESRQVTEEIEDGPLGDSISALDVIVTGAPPMDAVESYAARLAELPGATGAHISDHSPDDGAVRISVPHGGDSMAQETRDLVSEVRAASEPEGATNVFVGGTTAAQIDLEQSLADHLPGVMLAVVAVTLVLLFAAFGSVVLPLKAVLMAALSLGASFGAIVWVFQEGNLAGPLDFTPTGTVEPTMLVLVLVVSFGLSTDYEVFLLSRARAEWLAGRDNTSAVTEGVHRTGGVITSAALLMCVVLAAFSTAEITIVKLLGVGLLVAIVIDASLVRMVLVPATMRMLGSLNWWLPRSLRALHDRIGFNEEERETLVEDAPTTEAPSQRPSTHHRPAGRNNRGTPAPPPPRGPRRDRSRGAVRSGRGNTRGRGRLRGRDRPRVTGEEWLDERTVDITVDSPAMGEALPVRLLGPPGWDPHADPRRTWPVLYLLHGEHEDYTAWTRHTDVADLSARSRAVIAMPEGGRAGNYSDWYNYGRHGAPAWETFHLEEVWWVLRTMYRARDRRAVAGASSGGYGAVIYAARNPGTFTAAASFSGLLAPRSHAGRELLMATLRSEGLDPYALWGFPGVHERVWREHDPLRRVEGLRGTALYLSSGTTGPPGDRAVREAVGDTLGSSEALCAASLRSVAAELERRGIPATVNLYQGGTHSWASWERELHASWPMLMGCLGAAATPARA
ncbi:MMPL family transporter [Halostreptopolyspora alba]|uniref:SSD domain-containing protein n=1 Tax=Halostreptopolyspora alba TaxID=2487137 RepID=A0A3N0E9L3_9ACTN|nr:hypothetical protein EFW17_11445 [Nocardiopsaceae bacterium YIM 96095]